MSTGMRQIFNSDLRSNSSVQTEQLGAVAGDAYGRQFRYGKAGASNIGAGLLTVRPANVANHVNRTIAGTVAAGVTEVTLNVGATAVTAGQYEQGLLNINDATGEGYEYRIKGHTTSAGSTAITVSLEEPIQSALTVSVSEASLVKNPYDSVVTSATLAKAAGVTKSALTAAYHGWLAVEGEATVLSDGGITLAKGVIQSDAVAGAVEIAAAATDQVLGWVSALSVDTEYRLVNLSIRG